MENEIIKLNIRKDTRIIPELALFISNTATKLGLSKKKAYYLCFVLETALELRMNDISDEDSIISLSVVDNGDCFTFSLTDFGSPYILTRNQQEILRRKIVDRFSKIGSQKDLVPCNLSELAESVVDYYRSRVPKNVSVTLENNSNEALQSLANPTLIEWVIENLVKNAIDAMSSGTGSIQVILNADGNKAIVDVKATKASSGVNIQIQDSIVTNEINAPVGNVIGNVETLNSNK